MITSWYQDSDQKWQKVVVNSYGCLGCGKQCPHPVALRGRYFYCDQCKHRIDLSLEPETPEEEIAFV